MIAPTTWRPFTDEAERLEFYRLWGLATKTEKTARQVIYHGCFAEQIVPCEVLGIELTTADNPCAVIRVGAELHCIHGEYLAELQPTLPAKLLGDLRFADLWNNYVVLDIETTGLSREYDRIIEIAAIRYHCGQAEDTYHTMVNPGCAISDAVTDLTGITQDDVADAPSIDAVADDFLAFLGDFPVMGHNIKSFDLPFLSYQLGWEFQNPVIDTLSVARRSFPGLRSYKLQELDKTLCLGSKQSHRALADVSTTHQLFLACLTPNDYADQVIAAMKPPKPAVVKSKPEQAEKEHRFKNSAADRAAIKPTVEVDTSSPLYGKNIVFTGELSMSRKEAMGMAVNAGAVLKNSISGKTDYLVVGAQDTKVVGEDNMSIKEEKAYALNASGKAHIQIIREDDFRRLASPEGAKETVKL